MSSSQSSNININLQPGLAILSCDITHLHADLGSIEQVFRQEEDAFPYMGGQTLFVSSFSLFPAGGSYPSNFSHLDSEVKAKIWDEVFALKTLYLEKQIPDVIQHIVKHPFSIDRRFELYKQKLANVNYDMWHDKTNIWFERK